MEQKTGIQEAVDKFGGSPSRLAEAVGSGVLRQHVEHWLKVGRVSAERCPDVHAATGVPCSALNDRVNWALLAPPATHDAGTAVVPIEAPGPSAQPATLEATHG